VGRSRTEVVDPTGVGDRHEGAHPESGGKDGERSAEEHL